MLRQLCYTLLKRGVAYMEKRYGTLKADEKLIHQLKTVCAVKKITMIDYVDMVLRQAIKEERESILRILDE